MRILRTRCGLAAATLLLITASAWAEGEQANPVDSGSLYNALWALGIFLVLLVILGRYAWKPILKQMADREKQVADTIATAQAQQQESEKLLQAYQAKLASADEETARQMEKTRQAAEAARQEILTAAKGEAEKLSAKARDEIEQARKDALNDLYRFAADLATDAAGKILRRELKPEDQRRLVAESLELIRQRAANQ